MSIAMGLSQSYWSNELVVVGYNILRAALWGRLVAFYDYRIC